MTTYVGLPTGRDPATGALLVKGDVSPANLPLNVKDYGALGTGAAEPATPFQNAYNDAKALGRDVLIPAGTYLVSDVGSLCVISVGRDNAGTAPKVRVVMEPGVTIKLSANTPRLIDFKRTADEDLIHDFELDGQGALIDANNVGGSHHVIAGTFGSGLTTAHLNFKRIKIRNLRGINCPSDATSATSHRLWVDIHPSHTAAGQTQTVIEDVTVENLDLTGGNQGVGVMGGGADVLGQDIKLDRITVRDINWDSGVVPTAAGNQAGVHLGSRGYGGRCTISRCVVKNSADVGIEVDGFDHSLVEDCDAYESINPFYTTNFNNLQRMSEQEVTWRNCRARRYSLSLAPGAMWGFRAESTVVGGVTVAAPRVVYDRCVYHRTTTEQIGTGEGWSVKGTIRDTTLNKCAAIVDGLSLTGTDAAGANVIYVENNGASIQTLDMNENELTIGGTYVSGTPSMNAVRLNGLLRLSIDGFKVRLDVTSWAAAAARAFDIGNLTSTITGHIRDVQFLSVTGFTNLQQIVIAASGTLTISDRLIIADCKFQNQNTDVRFLDATNTSKVVLRDNTYASGSAVGSITVASAATVNAPAAPLVFISGTTNITSIAACPQGTVQSFKFAGVLTLTNGSNLKLAGAANFVTTADDVWTAVCDGTNWYEISRAAD